MTADAVRDLRAWTAATVGRPDTWIYPFPDEAKSDPGHLLVIFLKGSVTAKAVQALQEAVKGREVIRPGGRELYITYPDGIGRSKLTGALIERKLGARGTGRNWNTVMKLQALLTP